MAATGAKVTGLDGLNAAFEIHREQTVRKLAAGLYQEAEQIMGLAKEKYVPVDLGPLRASGYVELPIIKGDQVSVVLGFGGPSAPYALTQHENMDFNHTTGGPKYLERPALERAPGIPGRLKARL